jgi:hypothetical protein
MGRDQRRCVVRCPNPCECKRNGPSGGQELLGPPFRTGRKRAVAARWRKPSSCGTDRSKQVSEFPLQVYVTEQTAPTDSATLTSSGILLVPSRGRDSAPPAIVSTLGGVVLWSVLICRRECPTERPQCRGTSEAASNLRRALGKMATGRGFSFRGTIHLSGSSRRLLRTKNAEDESFRPNLKF